MQNKYIKFKTLHNKKLILPCKLVEKLLQFRQIEELMGESGGLFLGRHLNESGNIFIDQITSPSDEDKATKTSFWRSSVHWYKAIDIWKKEKETCAYIGQWHTHPEKTPNPSCVDTNEWMKSLKQDTYHDKYLYFMIIGVDVIRVWQNDLINGFSELERL